ncbi:MAG: carbamoyl-phosphate synthase (glutamine-hydrolyzing) small subunit [bacterium (Candidatus Stahlbacteria) CG08_land_8_20_14_0_20_40_26]|nr:MAG: carbamoyl phosphate synthase small subunit [bacterium (Candidatus Stahlbacteria) CG23_combo_of_CG06-09_8_20_14_all_40_9]PIS25201.1 MAG: carbamoyl-phosphate synthase (glutamine-hydrolyzing) small subunit [bacterium (Candidatus Stahlbacteria) CG08_land_8_20_14_0_20_40_26]
MESKKQLSKLVLEDGSIFTGYSFGSKNAVTGEVVFNTGMVGYPETLTDPSYKGQILVLTYPLIGNYGVPGDKKEDNLLKYFESDKIHLQGLVIADYSDKYSHWNAEKSLSEWMKEYNIPGIYGVDTRELTKKLREKGTMPGKIIYDRENAKFEDPNKRNLVAEVSIKEPFTYKKGKKKVIIIDCGVKHSIIRAFLRRSITVFRCPWNYNFLQEKAEGIVISNGPGDPKMCKETIENVRRVISKNIPILGICLGSQILGLAVSANTYKLKYGHRSQNQPCVEVGTKRCYITSQNHGYAIDSDTLPEDWREWFYNNNDKTNEGIIHISKPFFGTQFHPEASPGPDDTEFLFDMFLRAIK